jgi:hypothetical protein
MNLLRLLRSYFSLGVIIGPLPNNIVDGTLIDAVPVMANFNWIVSQVNANAAAGNILNAASIPTFVQPGAVGGTGNAVTLTPVPAIVAYTAGTRFSFVAIANNTGAVTVAVSGLGTRPLKYCDGTSLTGSELIAGGVYDIEDNGANYILMNSSQGSNILNWTPSLTFGGAAVGMAYSTQVGTAYKIGRFVFFAYFIVLTAKGSSTGQAVISGLPFPCSAGWQGDNGGPVFSSNLTYSGQVMMAFNLGASTMFFLNSKTATAFTTLDDTAFANTTQIGSSMFYPV